jgi:iron complex transport system substrate-binding protein
MMAGCVVALLLVCASLTACSDTARSNVEPDHTDALPIASRVVTLAPNLTELVFAAGAGQSLVGVSAYSDYPPQALDLPLVGDAFMVDQEQLALLQPDLLLVWQSGTPAHVVDELRGMGYRVESIRTRGLEDVAAALLRIGELTGHSDDAARVAKVYQTELQSLSDRFSGKESLSVFYQIYSRPLYTLKGEHYVSELIKLCGGRNVFAGLSDLAPTIDVEAVIDLDPEVMLASTDASDDAFAEWSRWPHVAANKYGNHFLLPADEIGRATPRLIVAGEALCAALQTARERKGNARGLP